MYDNIVTINKNFKSSVNLQYDLKNKTKILNYVPTTDLCDVIRFYLKNVNSNQNKSTILAGPYGKGKSYLMLMISYLLSQKYDYDLYVSLKKKIGEIDPSLCKEIENIEHKANYLLPVIINNNSFDDINQNFILALSNSLQENGITDIVPNTAFSECLKEIEKWENDFESERIFSKCIEKTNCTLEQLKLGLSNFDINSFMKFKDLFSCINHGYVFNPLISNDISNIFADVTRKIKKYGYKGIFVIFDEFGVFLNNQTSTDFTSKLNKLQSFAEKCNSSEIDSQMHFCCITHKELSLYNKNKNLKDSFETISGRFKQIRFDRSLEENYQIICSAIEKKSDFNTEFTKYGKKINELKSLCLNTNIFSSEEQINYLLESGFPFNPVSLYSLINVSEKVGQNERTLFTFLSDSDSNGFSYFINNNASGFLNIPTVYDYFENIIKESEEYKKIYFSVESAKRGTIKQEEYDIFKSIALLKIINDDVKAPCNLNTIAASLAINVDVVKSRIDSLIDRNILKRNLNDSSIDFAIISNSDVLKYIDSIIASKFANNNLPDMLTVFDKEKYHVSNRYNFECKMTRYFKSVYLNINDFISLKNIYSLTLGEFSDGVIVNLIDYSSDRYNEVLDKVASFNDNIIVRLIEKHISNEVFDDLLKINAANWIISNERKISNEMKNALPILVEDISYEVNQYIKNLLNDSKCLTSNGLSSNLQNAIYECLSSSFSKTVKFNNEQINKNGISTQSAKSRNVVVDFVLNCSTDKERFGSTSAEATILKSFDNSLNNCNDVIEVIKNYFISSDETKICASSLIEKLTSKPYGMRLGIIPLFIAKAVSELTITSKDFVSTVLLYNAQTQVDVNSTNISKVVSNPSKYFFSYNKINSTMINEMNKLIELFKVKKTVSFNDNLNCLIKEIRSFVSNLPPIVIKNSEKENLLKLKLETIKLKEVFLKNDINNFDILFKELPSLFKCSIDKICELIQESISDIKQKILEYQNRIISLIKAPFYKELSTIKENFDLWKLDYPYIGDIVFEDNEKRILKALETIQFNDLEAANRISFAIVKSSLDDLNVNKIEMIEKSLFSFAEKIYNFDFDSSTKKESFVVSENIQFTSLGKTLYSNLKETIDEYGDSLGNAEKITILKKLLNEILD